MSERNLVLDTCALIWLTTGAPELSDRAKAAIDGADTVWVSAISAWEIMKIENQVPARALLPAARHAPRYRQPHQVSPSARWALTTSGFRSTPKPGFSVIRRWPFSI